MKNIILTKEQLLIQHINVPFNNIDVTHFPIQTFNNINIDTTIIYQHNTGNPDIPYVTKILKETNKHPNKFINSHIEEQINKFKNISLIILNNSKYTNQQKKHMKEVIESMTISYIKSIK